MSFNFEGKRFEKTADLTKRIKETLVVDGAVITVKEGMDPYVANAPADFTPEMLEALAKYNNEFVNATHIAIAETALPEFQANKELSKIIANVSFGNKSDKMKVTVSRENSGTANGHEYCNKLHMATTFKIGGNGLAPLRAEISELVKDLI